MAGAAIRIDDREVRRAIVELQRLGADPRELLGDIGEYYVGETKANFTDKKASWAPKPPHWVMWEGGKSSPLTYKGRLQGSITHDVRGFKRLRVGSPLRYAATHQFGDDEQRSFYVYIIPELDAEGKRQYVDGYLKGKLTTKRAKTAVRVLVRQRVKARPFLLPPSAQQADEIRDIIGQHISRALEGRA